MDLAGQAPVMTADGSGGFRHTGRVRLCLCAVLPWLLIAAASLESAEVDAGADAEAEALAPLWAEQAPEPPRSWPPSDRRLRAEQRILVGVIIAGREVGTMEVIPDGERYLLPLEPFLDLTGCQLIVTGDLAQLRTPLGTVDIPPEARRTVGGAPYLDQRFVERQLASPVIFDAGQFALRLDLAWQPGALATPTRAAAAPIRPDVRPPQVSLSTLRTEVSHLHDRSSDRTASATTLGGRLFDGWWRMRYQDDFADNQRLRDYAWLRPLDDHTLLQVGHQQVNLHPLLRGVELTGAQLGWTNQPLDLFSRYTFEPGELLPRRGTPVRSFRGEAPPAGIAELWVDDFLVARQSIGLNGTYEFEDVNLPARLSRVEVRVFERQNPSVPVAVYEQTLNLSGFLLAAGGTVHLGGAGRDGNLIDASLNDRGDDGDAAFYQWRHGLSERLTLEAAVQRSRENLQLMGGVVAQLSPGFLVSLGLGSSEGDSFGYSLDLDGRQESWRLVGRSEWRQAGFQAAESEETFDHFLELDYQRSPTLRFGFVGRSRQVGGERTDFLLPTLTWRASRRLSLRARPEVEGDYRFDLNYSVRRNAQLAVSVQRRTYSSLTWGLRHNLQLFASADFGGGQEDRYGALLSWSGNGRWQPSLAAGPLYAAGQSGFRTSASLAVLPGILARIELEQDPLRPDRNGRQNLVLQANVTADLALSRGRLLPARSIALRQDRGAISGRIRIEAPVELPRYRLEDVAILLDGRPVGRTEAGGSFFLGDLKPGLYRLQMDTENLPIELTPEDIVVTAEVASASVTRVDFTVRPEFGLAGRLTDLAGSYLANRTVEILDASGRLLQSAVSDEFGLYRIDGLPIGRYTLRLSPQSLPPGTRFSPPSRSVEIKDDFLFEQDLELPVVLSSPE